MTTTQHVGGARGAPRSEHTAAIAVRGLSKSFRGTRGTEVHAVRGIDLTVAEGEIFGFLGPNGAGKSTTVQLLTTLLRPGGGSAEIHGIDIAEHPHRVRHVIGVALQDAGLDRSATAAEFLTLQARLQGLPRRVARGRARDLLATVGLAEVSERQVTTFSGGMRRRLDLASALVHEPRVLFLDEPTTGLDPKSRRDIWTEVRRLNVEEGITVFLTTQYLEEADALAGRLAIIDGGRIVTEGPPEALKGEIGADVVRVETTEGTCQAAVEAVRDLTGLRQSSVDGTTLTLFLSEGPERIAEILRRLDRGGVPVGAVTMSRPSLDDVFLCATGHRLGFRPTVHWSVSDSQ